MEKEEVEKLLADVAKKNGEAISEAVKNEIGAATKGLITEAGLIASLEKAGVSAKSIQELTAAVEKQGTELNKMLNGGNRQVKSLDEVIHEQAEAIKSVGSNSDKKLKFKVSANGNVEKTMVSSASVTGSTLSYREQQIGMLAAPNTVFDRVFRTVNLSETDLAASNGVITYMDVTAETNNAAETAETTSTTVGSNNKPESAITWQEYSASLRVIADTIPVTRNSYRHLGFIQSEIDRLLRKNHAQRKDKQIYNGDGNSPNIKGIYTYTTAVTLASLPRYQAVSVPNLGDLVMDLGVYVSNKSDATGAQSKYAPNAVILNPADALKFLEKGSDGHYVMPPFMMNGRVGNMQIIESPRVGVGTMLVGDTNYGTIYQSEDVVIEMGLVNDQFLKNQWTIRAEQELCFLQRNADLGAFVKVTDIAAAIAALTKP